MASTYSDLKIELIGTGEQAGTWGSTTNTNLGTALQEAITGSADVAFSSADVTLTLTNSNGAQVGRNLRLNLTGTSSGALNLILGAEMQVEKLYLINNTLADAVTVKNTTGTGIAVPAGKTMFVFNNGTNVVDAITYLTSLETASLVATTADINGGSIDGATLGTNSAITEADIDNININGNTISTTDTDGSLTLTPDGTGEVVTSKFMRGTFSDKVTAIGNTSTAATVDLSLGTVFTATLTGNCTFTFSNPNGVATTASSFTLILTNDATPSRSIVVAWNCECIQMDPPARTETAAATDIWFFFTPDGGSTYYGSIPIKNAFLRSIEMALTEEQLNQIEFQKAQQAANNPDRMEAVRLARDILMENDRNKPTGERGIAASDITAFAEAIVTFAKQ
jgi:hypothetical protein